MLPYSLDYKGSANIITQNMEDKAAYPSRRKIDLMKFAEGNKPNNYFKRAVLSTEDSLGLLWLSKINIIGILCFLLFLSSCQKEFSKNTDREIVDYYNGIVVDKNHKAIENVKVTMYVVNPHNGKIIKDTTIQTTSTNKKGYFAIKDKTIDTLHIFRVQSESRKLFFEKKGYLPDTVRTNTSTSSYRPKYDIYDGLYFIFKIPDTIILYKNEFDKKKGHKNKMIEN